MNFSNTTGSTEYQSSGDNFGFKPILGLEIAALALFTILTLTLLVMNILKRSWFMMPLVVGGGLEILGFGSRIWETYNPYNEAGYIIYLVPVLVAPTVLAASDYALSSHIMNKAGIHRIFIFSPKVTKYLFLICDIAAFFIQAIGGAIASSANTVSGGQAGMHLVLAGLAISLAVFVVFLFISICLHLKARQKVDEGEDRRWLHIFYIIYINMFCLIVRAIYRVAEFAQPNYHNSISDNETYFYVLDVLLMLVLMAVWIPFHPGRWGLGKVTPGDK